MTTVQPETWYYALLFAGGALCGLLIGWFAARAGLAERIGDLRARVQRLQAELREKERAEARQQALLEAVRSDMLTHYRALVNEALRDNNRAFLDLAQNTLSGYLDSARQDLEARRGSIAELLTPLRQTLDRYDRQLQEIERSRENAYGGLTRQVAELSRSQQELQRETARLATALQVPHVRGRWGEMTLRRVAELAGMVNRCDFFEQQQSTTDGVTRRPDMVVHLPGGRLITVDAKAPLDAYLKALAADNENERQKQLRRHCEQLSAHVMQLSQKAYWTGIDPSPEFTVLFIPGENFFSAALAEDDGLIETAARRGIVLATPTTLISLLKTVALAWRQETTAHNARAIAELGGELYGRLLNLAEQLQNLGRSIEKCADSYNGIVGSFERRVLVSARRFEELGISSGKGRSLPELSPVQNKLRNVDGKGHR